MEKNRFFLALFLTTILCFVGFQAAIAGGGPDPMVLIGQKAPILSGKKATGGGLLKLNTLMREIGYQKDDNGKFIEKNGEYVLQVQNRVVVLNFFSVTCIPCIREIPTYNKLAKKYENKDVKMIYVNIDADVTPRKISAFIKKRKIEVPMMLPNQKSAVNAYMVNTLPRIVIIDKGGKIAHILKGFKEDLAAQLTEIIDELLKQTV
ncbi:MAG: TlpA family protein disulfide reductase [Deltaproteobacteria bacterium]|nr:TlpA family protein disulfide reductase [Deltaproteobacteria bacterium]